MALEAEQAQAIAECLAMIDNRVLELRAKKEPIGSAPFMRASYYAGLCGAGWKVSTMLWKVSDKFPQACKPGRTATARSTAKFVFGGRKSKRRESREELTCGPCGRL
ncbi:hypothetical protein U1701_18155 [Sphingomonas sp. PB2P19]|uniref:hypothetical protein n=1 Tax=Sphingomonas rhamnosi TaxID=3096156 RepID=UPI002FC9AD37